MSTSIPTRRAVLAAGLLSPFSRLSAAPQGEFIYETAPFPSCHASTIVDLGGGELMSAWFGGADEGKPDVAIWASRRVGGKWTTPEELAREFNVPCWNPVLFHTKDGKLWMYYKFGRDPQSWTGGRRFSTDKGKTWSPIEHLPAGLYGPIRAKPLVLADGTIVSGTSVESYRSWATWIERSTDGGATWTKFGPISVAGRPVAPSGEGQRNSGIIQPAIVSLGGRKLRLYARSTTDIGKICVADSTDLGRTWTQAREIDLPNNNSGIDAVTLRDGRVVLLYNHTPRGRTPLNLAVSRDGESFKMFLAIEEEPGEYSYPALIQGADGDLHMTYTWKRQKIKYVRVPLADVPK